MLVLRSSVVYLSSATYVFAAKRCVLSKKLSEEAKKGNGLWGIEWSRDW